MSPSPPGAGTRLPSLPPRRPAGSRLIPATSPTRRALAAVVAAIERDMGPIALAVLNAGAYELTEREGFERGARVADAFSRNTRSRAKSDPVSAYGLVSSTSVSVSSSFASS